MRKRLARFYHPMSLIAVGFGAFIAKARGITVAQPIRQGLLYTQLKS